MHASVQANANIKEFIRRDKQAAIEFLYREYGNMLYGFIYSTINNHEATQTILNHVFEELPKRIHTYDENNLRIYSWLLQLTRKKLGNAVLKSPAGQEWKQGKDFPTIINRMGRKHAEIFTLAYVVGYSAREIAVIKNTDADVIAQEIKLAAREFAKSMKLGE
ncbi:MAG: hypothetical protein QM731_28690 [Chitinophagaceae bacterium]